MPSNMANAFSNSWLMDDNDDSVYAYLLCSYISERKVYQYGSITPVLNLIKDFQDFSLENQDDSNNNKYNYKLGDIVSYNGEDYYVLKDSIESSEYVELLKAEPLSHSVIEKYYDGEIRDANGIAIVSLDEDGYNLSIVHLIDKWAADNFGDDIYREGPYNAYLLHVETLVNQYFFEQDFAASYHRNYYRAGIDTPKWLVEEYDYWTSATVDHAEKSMWLIGKYNNGIYSVETKPGYKTNYAAVRPFVYVKKCALNGGECECPYKKLFNFTKYKNYSRGDKVSINNESYIVVNSSDSNVSYVTLIKEMPLSANDINRYGIDNKGRNIVNNYVRNSLTNSAYEYDNGVGGMQYYSNINCGYVDGQLKSNECNGNYQHSYVKIVIDNWAKDNFNLDNLININGYKVRLINYTEALSISKYLNINYAYWVKGSIWNREYSSNVIERISRRLFMVLNLILAK